MFTLLLYFFFIPDTLANTRVQFRCGEILSHMRNSGFDAAAISEGLAGRYFIFENESKSEPLGLVERRALGLSEEAHWRADELTFQFAADDGAGLRLSAQVGFEKVGRRALLFNGLAFGFQNLSSLLDNAETFRGVGGQRALDRLIARSLGKTMRATIPLVRIGPQWAALLFTLGSKEVGHFIVSPRIGLVLTRPCGPDRLGPETLVTEDGNLCLTEIGRFNLPGPGPLEREPAAAPIELRP